MAKAKAERVNDVRRNVGVRKKNNVETDLMDFDATTDYIPNNIFYREISTSSAKECALWILHNDKRVKNKIRKTFESMGYGRLGGTDEIEECYDEMVYYFIEFTHNAFDKNYFNHKQIAERIGIVDTLEDLEKIERELNECKCHSESEYKIEHYLLNRVHNCALGYIRYLKQSGELLRFDFDEYDENNKQPGMITMDKATADKKYKEVNLEISPDSWADYSDLQDIFDNELYIYDEDIRSQGLPDFDTKRFIQAIFLSDFETEEEKAEFLNLHVAQLNTYQSGFKLIVKNELGEGGEFRDLIDSVKKLIEGYSHGWRPQVNEQDTIRQQLIVNKNKFKNYK